MDRQGFSRFFFPRIDETAGDLLAPRRRGSEERKKETLQRWRRRRRRSEKGGKEMKNQGIKGRLRRRLKKKGRSKQQSEGPAKLKEGWEEKEEMEEGIATRDIGLPSLSLSPSQTTKSFFLLPYPYFRLINAIDSEMIFLFRRFDWKTKGFLKFVEFFLEFFDTPLTG